MQTRNDELNIHICIYYYYYVLDCKLNGASCTFRHIHTYCLKLNNAHKHIDYSQRKGMLCIQIIVYTELNRMKAVHIHYYVRSRCIQKKFDSPKLQVHEFFDYILDSSHLLECIRAQLFNPQAGFVAARLIVYMRVRFFVASLARPSVQSELNRLKKNRQNNSKHKNTMKKGSTE